MRASHLVAAAFAAWLLAPCAMAQSASPAAPVVAAPAARALLYLDPVEFAPANLLPPPPPAGSLVEKIDLETVRRIGAAATPRRLAQANWDGDHEDPSAFSTVMGRDLTALPATMALLTLVQEETDRVAANGKDHFGRLRPYALDPTLPHCGNGSKAARAYPSGHAAIGFALAWTLARLEPAKTSALLERAGDYAMSRVICGVHYISDTSASQAIGTLVADRLMADPRLAEKIAAAHRELSGT
jgi:acid phosphatase (class A)